MSTLIIERTEAEHQTPVRRAAPADLIHPIGGVHSLATGAWEIGRGQSIQLTARGLRTASVPTRVAHGTLVVTDELLGSSLDFTVLVPDTESYIGFSTRVSRLLSVECWQGVGTVTTAGGSCPVSLILRYNGVFAQRGRPQSLWLTIQATVVLPEVSVAVVGRRVRRLKIAAELNLNPLGQLRGAGASASTREPVYLSA